MTFIIILLFSVAGYATQDVLTPAEETVIPESLLKQVEAGHAESAFFIASAFADGSMGIEKNLIKAKEWFLKSAEMGYVHGMFELGKLFYQDKAYPQAKQWFEKASNEGHGEAFYRLSIYHIYQIDGQGFDCKKAYELLQEAQLRGVKAAFNDHAWMLSTLPQKSCRNGQKAWKIYAELQSLYSSMEPIPWAYLDTKAAVLAEIADYNESIEVQSWVVEDFCDIEFSYEDAKFKESVDSYTEQFSQTDDELCFAAIKRLQTYVNRQPWREEPKF